MRPLQVVGVVLAILLGGYGIFKYHRGRYRRVDLLIALLISIGLLTVSISPAIGDIPARWLGMQVRWFTVLFVSIIILFGLFFHALNRVNGANRTIGELVRALAKTEIQDSHALEDKRDKSIFIVIPAYNEERTIGTVVKGLPKEVLSHEIVPIVVVDGAKDRTAEVARREDCLVASHPVNRGQGDALHTGFDIALNQGADIVMTMDADGQNLPEEIEGMVEPILNGYADYVQGSRFLGEYEDRGSIRHIGVVMFTFLINFLGRMSITDCASGFRAIRGTELAKLELHEKQFSASEILLEASRKGLRIKEVPMTFARRSHGQSKKPRGVWYPLGYLRTMVATWLR